MYPRRDSMLDVIRGIAILWVLLFHLRVATGSATLDRLLRPLIDVGWVGVDLFFVLSGFLVGGLVFDQLASPAGFSRRRFFARRVLRLWPVLYLYLAILLLAGGTPAWTMVLPVVLHVQNFATGVPNHLWSLAVEEHFYLAVALLTPWLWRRGGPGGLAIALFVPLGGCLLLRLGALAAGAAPVAVQWQTPYRIDALAAGMLVAWGERNGSRVLIWLQARRAGCLAIAAAAFAGLAAVDDPRIRYGFGLTVAWMAAALVIVGLRRMPLPRRAAPLRLLAWLGGISYSVYVWHVSLGRLADATAPFAAAPAVTAWRYAVVLAGATLIVRLVERPFMRLRPSATTAVTPQEARLGMA